MGWCHDIKQEQALQLTVAAWLTRLGDGSVDSVICATSGHCGLRDCASSNVKDCSKAAICCSLFSGFQWLSSIATRVHSGATLVSATIDLVVDCIDAASYSDVC